MSKIPSGRLISGPRRKFLASNLASREPAQNQGSRALCARPSMSVATSLRRWPDRSRGVELSNPKTACAIVRALSAVSVGRTSWI